MPNETGGQPRLAIYRRFRAQTFAQIAGQPAVVETLRNAVRLGRLGHGFLFVGPRGTGKTSMARILAKAVNCTDLRDGEPCDTCPSCVAIREGRALDVIELDAASNNKVDDMRELLPRVYTAPADLRHKVFIIDEVQRIKEGWDVLLKTLEEPPPGVLFVFCTTDASQIRPAVVSRLQRFTFRPLPRPEIAAKLERILAAEGREAESAAVALIAELAAGGMRDAESMLDQVLASASDPITADGIRDLLGLPEAGAVTAFVDALVAADVLSGIGVLDALDAEGRDVVAFADQVVADLRARLVDSLGRPGDGGSGRASALAAAARRLTGLDASRSGLGGYRWQLELCLLAAAVETREASVPTVPPREATAPPREAGAGSGAREDRAVAGPLEGARSVEGRPSASAAPAHVPVGPAETPPLDGGVAPGTTLGAAPRPAASPAGAPPAPASPPHAPRTGGAGPATDDPLEVLRLGWPRVVELVGRNPANRPIVAACRPVEMRDGVLILGFPEDQAFLRDVAERKRAALEAGVSAVVGRPLGVRCVVTNLELVAPTAPEADDLVAQARRIFDDELADVGEIG